MTSVVYPAIHDRVIKHTKQLQESYARNKHIIKEFPVGSIVYALDNTRTDKMVPRYEGPFTVVKLNQGGAYIIQGPDGTTYQRAPSQLKLVKRHSLNIAQVNLNTNHIYATVAKILGHNQDGATCYYLVKC